MATKLNIEMTGLVQAQKILKVRIHSLEDMSPPLKAIVRDFYAAEKEWFDSEGAGQWKPLSPSYAAWKSKKYPGKKMLRRTDRMYRQFTGGGGGNYRIERTKAVIKIDGVDYWTKHRDGDPSTGLPARTPLIPNLLATHGAKWRQMMTEWLSKQTITRWNLGG